MYNIIIHFLTKPIFLLAGFFLLECLLAILTFRSSNINSILKIS